VSDVPRQSEGRPGDKEVSGTPMDAELHADPAAEADDAARSTDVGPSTAESDSVRAPQRAPSGQHSVEADANAPGFTDDSGLDVRPFDLEDWIDDPVLKESAKRVTMLNDINLRVKLRLGKTRMLIEDVLKLGEGSVVELDKLAGDPVDVLVNDRLVARGEVLVLNDNFCVRISEVLSNDPHRIAT